MLVLLAARDLLSIRATLNDARADLRALDLDEGSDVAAVAARAADAVTAADAEANDSVPLAIVGLVPGIRGQVQELRSVTSTLASLAPTLDRVGERVDAALTNAQTGAGRIALLDVIHEELTTVAERLAGIDTNRDHVAGPLGDAAAELDAEIERRRRDVDVGLRRVDAIRRMLIGPTRLLVLGGNNAEMSGGAGMPLTASVLDVAGGEFDLGAFVPTNFLVPRRGLPAPGDLGDLFPLHGVGYDFRGTTATANFPSIGPLLVDMSANTTTGPVDGVVLIDSFTVSALVGAVGSIVVEGETLDADAVFDDLVIGNYQRLGQPGDRPERYQLQDEYAQAVFDAVTNGEASPAALADALADAAATRHLLAWSPEPDLQELFEATGAAGRVGPDSLAVSVENMDGNKLDTFLQPRVTIGSVPQIDGGHLVTVAVEVTYPELPLGAQVPYVLGPTPGLHFVQTVFHIPRRAGPIQVLEAPELVFRRTGDDGDSTLHTGLYEIPQGESRRYAIRFRLPPEIEQLEVVPSARPLGQLYETDQFTALDYAPFVVPLDPPAPEISRRERVSVVASGALLLGATLVVAATSPRRRRAPLRRGARRRVVGAGVVSLLACLIAVAAAA